MRNVSCYCQNCFSNGHFHPTCQGWTVLNLVSDDNLNELVKPVDENHTAKYAIHSFVAAIYNDEWYIGKVLEYGSEDNEYNISFMRENVSKVRYRYKWPHKYDIFWIAESNILCQVGDPVLFGKKEVYKMNDDINKIIALFNKK